ANSGGLDLFLAGFRVATMSVRLLFPGRKCIGPHHQSSSSGQQLHHIRYGALLKRALGPFFVRSSRRRRPLSRDFENSPKAITDMATPAWVAWAAGYLMSIATASRF